MQIIDSTLDTRSDEFRANSESMKALVADLRAKTAQVAAGASEAARAKHVARGKLLRTGREPKSTSTGHHHTSQYIFQTRPKRCRRLKSFLDPLLQRIACSMRALGTVTEHAL